MVSGQEQAVLAEAVVKDARLATDQELAGGIVTGPDSAEAVVKDARLGTGQEAVDLAEVDPVVVQAGLTVVAEEIAAAAVADSTANLVL